MTDIETAKPAAVAVYLDDHTADTIAAESTLDVAFYGRASLDRSGLQSSVTTQERKFDKRAATNDWRVLERFIDNDISASKRKVRRPAFERMMRKIEQGELKPDLIVAYDVSRLMRNRGDKIRLEQLIDSGIHLHDMRYGIDTRQQLGRIVFGIMAEMAIDRAQELAQYQRDYHERRRADGKPSKGIAGLGYQAVTTDEGRVVGFTIDEVEARAIRWAVRELREGASLRSVVQAWNDPDHPHHLRPRRAKRFSNASVRVVVCSARIAGCVESPTYDQDGRLTSVSFIPNTDGTLPAIVSAEDVLTLRERFKINALRAQNGSGVGRRAVHLLSGICECSECGGPMYRGIANKVNTYRCLGCADGRRGLAIVLRPVEEFVIGALFERLRSGVLVELLARATTSDGVEAIAKKIAFEEDELRRFEQLVEDGQNITPEQFLRYTGAKEAKIAKLREALAEELASAPESLIPTLPEDILENLEAYWAEADIEWKRRLIRLCFERIVIHPADRRGRRTVEQTLSRVELIPRGQAVPSDERRVA